MLAINKTHRKRPVFKDPQTYLSSIKNIKKAPARKRTSADKAITILNLMILSYHDQNEKAVLSKSHLVINLVRPYFLCYKFNMSETADKDSFIYRSWIKY